MNVIDLASRRPDPHMVVMDADGNAHVVSVRLVEEWIANPASIHPDAYPVISAALEEWLEGAGG
ncbi:MAG: hypothetical protein GY835_23865 [bacterium]|nr:hypothetical protein [bacterium]